MRKYIFKRLIYMVIAYHFDLLPDANCTREPICQREGLAG